MYIFRKTMVHFATGALFPNEAGATQRRGASFVRQCRLLPSFVPMLSPVLIGRDPQLLPERAT